MGAPSKSWLTAGAVAALLAGCMAASPEEQLAAAKNSLQKNDSKAAIVQLKNVLQKEPQSLEARFLLGRGLLAESDFVGALVEFEKVLEQGYPRAQVVPYLAQALVGLRAYDKIIARFSDEKIDDPQSHAALSAVLGEAYLNSGKIDLAATQLAAALKLQPDQLQAKLLQTRIMAMKGDPKAALAEAEALTKRAPDSANAWVLQGDLFIAMDDVDAALVAYRQALKADPKHVVANTAVVQRLLLKGDIKGAQAQLDEFRAKMPRHPQVAFLEALVALESQDAARAKDRIAAVLKVAPDDVRALYVGAAAEYRLSNWLQAEKYAAKVLSINPAMQDARLLLARIQLRSGDGSKSLATLAPLLSGPPNSAALSLAGEVAMMQGDTAKAESYLAAAVKAAPDDKRGRTNLAMAYLAGGQVDKGIADLKSIAASDGGLTADFALINALIRKRDFDAAAAAIQAAEKKDGKNPSLAQLRGGMELSRGKTGEARAAFEAALKLDPTYLPAIAALTQLDVGENKFPDAIARFERALAKDPKNVKLRLGVWGLRAGQKDAVDAKVRAELESIVKDNPTVVAPRAALVRFDFERKQYKSAVALAQEALAAIPDDPTLLDLLGNAQWMNGDPNQALSTYGKLGSLQANSPVAQMRVAEIQGQLKNRPAVLQALKRVLEIQPDYVPAQRMLVLTEMAQGNTDKVRKVIADMQRQRPNEAVGFLVEGDMAQLSKNWAAAEAAYKKALARPPAAQTETVIKLHGVLLQEGKAAEAKALVDDWQRKAPKDVALLVYLGDRSLRQADYDAALRYYDDVLKLQPDSTLALNNKAWIMASKGQPEALDLALRANQIQPKQVNLMDTLADIYYRRGEFAKALETQRQIIGLDPNAPVHHFNMARYLIAAGKKKEAKDELLPLQQLGERFDKQAEVKKMLATL